MNVSSPIDLAILIVMLIGAAAGLIFQSRLEAQRIRPGFKGGYRSNPVIMWYNLWYTILAYKHEDPRDKITIAALWGFRLAIAISAILLLANFITEVA